MSSATQQGLESVAATHRRVGNRVEHIAETTSTMDETWRRYELGAQEGLVVVADAQTAGRGRHGRSWTSQAGRDLLFSILLKPRPAFAHELLVMASLACANAAREVIGPQISLKWPNDVLAGGQKLAGVLAESRQDGNEVAVVIGIGLNVNFDPRTARDVPNATSLMALSGAEISRADVLTGVLEAMDSMYLSLGKGETLVPEWRDLLETLGQRVVVSSADPRAPGVIVEGMATDVDEQGRLLVTADDGLTRAVAAGEVTLSSLES